MKGAYLQAFPAAEPATVRWVAGRSPVISAGELEPLSRPLSSEVARACSTLCRTRSRRKSCRRTQARRACADPQSTRSDFAGSDRVELDYRDACSLRKAVVRGHSQAGSQPRCGSRSRPVSESALGLFERPRAPVACVRARHDARDRDRHTASHAGGGATRHP